MKNDVNPIFYWIFLFFRFQYSRKEREKQEGIQWKKEKVNSLDNRPPFFREVSS